MLQPTTPHPAPTGSNTNTNLPQWHDMQGLVLSAYPHLGQAAYLLFRIDEVEPARNWLTRVRGRVTSAFERPPKNQHAIAPPNLNIALTATGITALGETAKDFSDPFIEGIGGQRHRSRILGDVDDSAPANWLWGGEQQGRNKVDVLVMVFADERDNLDTQIAAVRPTSLEGMTEVRCIKAWPLSQMSGRGREHFGFTDGISQPILEGTFDAERFPDSIHLTALGEVVLGYPNAFGVRLGEADAYGRPTSLPWLGRLPRVDNVMGFGRNGTYLVLRQLEQDVDLFRRAVTERTGSQAYTDPPARQLAAKIVGRWPDGTPLVPYATVDDNEFVYADDPYGGGCPIGAHVRRANPRDALLNNGRPFRPTNEHRVLRRGRIYGPPPPPSMPANDAERGLVFLCLNADLERQFEFIQQNWINNPAFGGLADECDPLVGVCGQHGGVFTMGGLPARQRVGLPRFVTVKGGEYFFLPGLEALRQLTL